MEPCEIIAMLHTIIQKSGGIAVDYETGEPTGLMGKPDMAAIANLYLAACAELGEAPLESGGMSGTSVEGSDVTFHRIGSEEAWITEAMEPIMEIIHDMNAGDYELAVDGVTHSNHPTLEAAIIAAGKVSQ